MIFRDEELDAQFASEGYVVVPLLARAEAEELRRGFNHPPDVGEQPFAASIMSGDAAYRRRVHEAIARTFASPLRQWLPDYRIAFCNFAVKGPSTTGTVPWHRDWTFVDESRYTSVGVWCPLTDVDATSGCLHVVPGSHRTAPDLRALRNTVASPEDTASLRTLPLAAGEAVLFSQRLLHMSMPNTKPATRVAACSVLAPRDVPMWYVHATGEAAFDLYEVDDDFYLRNPIGEQPAGVDPFARIG